jgi:hypothetical protein
MDPRIGRLAGLAAGAGLLVLAASLATAQDAPAPSPAAPPVGAAATTAAPALGPPPPDAQPADATPAPAAGVADEDEPAPAKPPAPPPPPPGPLRAPSAVLRVLDKVTAETLAFEAPVGRRVRFKSLVFEVKACETRGADDPEPQPSAYLVISSDAGAAAGDLLARREIFRGWVFANAPSLNALKHPVYDAWLVACSAATPAT